MNHTQPLLNYKSISYEGGGLPLFALASQTKSFESRPDDWQSSRLTKRGFLQGGLDL